MADDLVSLILNLQFFDVMMTKSKIKFMNRSCYRVSSLLKAGIMLIMIFFMTWDSVI